MTNFTLTIFIYISIVLLAYLLMLMTKSYFTELRNKFIYFYFVISFFTNLLVAALLFVILFDFQGALAGKFIFSVLAVSTFLGSKTYIGRFAEYRSEYYSSIASGGSMLHYNLKDLYLDTDIRLYMILSFVSYFLLAIMSFNMFSEPFLDSLLLRFGNRE